MFGFWSWLETIAIEATIAHWIVISFEILILFNSIVGFITIIVLITKLLHGNRKEDKYKKWIKTGKM